MDWCDANGVDYVFGLTGTKAPAAKVEAVADAIRVERATAFTSPTSRHRNPSAHE
jgi:hypothetical protein